MRTPLTHPRHVWPIGRWGPAYWGGAWVWNFLGYSLQGGLGVWVLSTHMLCVSVCVSVCGGQRELHKVPAAHLGSAML